MSASFLFSSARALFGVEKDEQGRGRAILRRRTDASPLPLLPLPFLKPSPLGSPRSAPNTKSPSGRSGSQLSSPSSSPFPLSDRRSPLLLLPPSPPSVSTSPTSFPSLSLLFTTTSSNEDLSTSGDTRGEFGRVASSSSRFGKLTMYAFLSLTQTRWNYRLPLGSVHLHRLLPSRDQPRQHSGESSRVSTFSISSSFPSLINPLFSLSSDPQLHSCCRRNHPCRSPHLLVRFRSKDFLRTPSNHRAREPGGSSSAGNRGGQAQVGEGWSWDG